MAAPVLPDVEAPAADEPVAVAPVRRPWWWVSGPGVAVGLVSAFIGLDRKSFWLDEAYTLGAVAQLGRTLRETSGTMALYYPVVTAWSQLSASVWWMRSLSVLMAVGALVVVGRLAARLVGDHRARLAVLLTALSWLWLVYAREARSYGMVMLLSALSWLALDHAVADDHPARRRWWAAHTLIAVLLPLAHGLALLQVVPQVAVLVAGRADRGAWARLARGVVLGGAVTVGLLATGAGEVGSHIPSLRLLHVQILLEELTSPFSLGVALVLVALGVGVAQRVATARATTDPVARARAVVPVAWALGPVVLLVALSFARPSLVTRYVVGVVPAIALLLVAAADQVDLRLPRARGATALVLVAVLAAGQVRYHLDDRRDGWQAATEAVAAGAVDGDDLLFAGRNTRPAFEAAWRGLDDPPALDVVANPRPLGRVLRFEAAGTDDDERWSAARHAGRVWLVGNPHTGERFTVDDLTTGPDATHREAGRWQVDPGGLTVVLLVPR